MEEQLQAIIPGILEAPNLAYLRTSRGGAYYYVENGLCVGLHLRACDLADHHLINILEIAQQGKHLRVLHLAENRLKNLRLNLPMIEYLELSSNSQLRSLRIEHTPKLQKLVANDCELNDVTMLTGGLELQSIELARNQLTAILFHASFPKLKFLDISVNLLSDFKIPTCPQLQYLFLGKSGIAKLSVESPLPMLNIVDLSSTAITELPEEFADCKELQEIKLENTKIEAVLPLINLPKLERVVLKNTPFEKKYAAEVETGWKAVKKLFDHNVKNIDFNHAKLLLLGNTNVGKSYLLHYFEKKKVPTSTKSKSTHGLEYKEITALVKGFHLHCWDFGGQEYYHATHELFFSIGALHLLLWSKEDEQRNQNELETCFEKEYWLRCIEQLSGDSKQKAETILIENKIDNQGFVPTPLNQEIIQQKFGEKVLLHYTALSLQPLRRMVGLTELIKEIVVQNTAQRPQFYQDYLDKIKAIKKPVVSISEIESKAAKQEALKTLLETFNNMGILLYFKEVLPDKVFTQPSVLLNFLYEQVFGREKAFKTEKSSIKSNLNKSDFDLSLEEALKLLEHFDLVFQTTESPNTYFIPQYLPDNPAWLAFFEGYHFQKANICMESDRFLMNLVMLKLYKIYGSSIKKEGKEYLFWKDGMVIEKEINGTKQFLLIKYNRPKLRLELYQDAKHDNFELQKEIVNTVLLLPQERQAISNENRELNWQNNVFDIWVSTDGLYYVKWQHLYDNVKKNILSIEANGIDEQGFTKTVSVFTFNNYLPNENKAKMKKVMISYSKDDLALVHRFLDALVPLHDSGLIENPWYCTLLEAGSEWNKEIQKQLKEADIVFFMCTISFLRTKYIREHEIKTAKEYFSDSGKQKPKIIPIVLNFCEWENYLGDFTALPYKVKPVVDFKNPEKAWYIVAKAIRMMIEKELDPTKEGELENQVRRIYEEIVAGNA